MSLVKGGRCDRCKVESRERYRSNKQDLCGDCLNYEAVLPKLEDFVYRRKSLESYMPETLRTGQTQVQKQVRKNAVKNKFCPVPYQHRVGR